MTGTLARVGTELFRQDTKTTAGRRVVPLVPEAVRALKAQRKAQAAEQLRAGTAWTSTGYVFTTEIGTPVDPRNALRWFYVIRDKAKLESGSWHTLRHSCASVLLTSGVPMPIVSAILGHSSISITVDTYGHLSPPRSWLTLCVAPSSGTGRTVESDSQSDSQCNQKQQAT